MMSLLMAKRVWRVVCGLVCVAGVGTLCAQSGTVAGEAPVPTLRVFVNLVQVPVLVLNSHLETVKGVDPSRFTVSIDSGPAAPPRHVRVEGDDPIALGVLLDVSGRSGVMGKMGDAFKKLSSAGLHPVDHVTVFARECHLFRSLSYTTPQPTLLADGIDRALAAWGRTAKRSPACTGEVHLWDAMYRVLQELSTQPGRRVLIAVSDGEDHGSKHSWNEVRYLAQGAGVAIFGLMDYDGDPFNGFGKQQAGGGEDPFQIVSERSGGLILNGESADVAKQLSRVLTLVRQRYVVEFILPRQNVGGEHDLLVKVAKGHPLVRPSGVSVLLPDPAVENDPMTIPQDTTNAPELGKRKILTPKPS